MTTASHPVSRAFLRRARRIVPLAAVGLPLTVAGGAWWFTEPLRPSPSAPPAQSVAAAVPADDEPEAAEPAARPVWPEGRLEGDPAKRILLDALLAARRRLDRVPAYTATFRKQERIRGKLGAEQTMVMKVRHEPFSIYLKFLKPRAGKEVVYTEGAHDGHVIAHNGDWTRRLIPRLKVAPTDPLALADNRHPITDAGLLNLTSRLVEFRRLDLDDEEAVTILDRTTDSQGNPVLRSVHSHPTRNDARPFQRVEVLYDPETFIPCQITSYDWPEPGDGDSPRLAEKYAYDDVDLDAPLNNADFDPANPEYAFTRF